MTYRTMTFGIFLCLGALALASCGGGGGGTGGVSGIETAGTLVLVDMSVGGFDGVALNEILRFDFSEDLDPDTVRPDTIRIREGPNYGLQVPGEYLVDGNQVYFFPKLPVLSDLSDSGLQPGTHYRCILPGAPTVATVRNYEGNRLPEDEEATFQTAVTGSPNLFIDNFLDPLPAQVLFVNPNDGATEVPASSTITLTCNRRPLNPGTVTSGNIYLTMLSRQGQPVNRPVSGAPFLSQSYDSVVIEFRPTYPLADEATYRLNVDRRVQDLVGNDVQPFTSTFTIRNEPFRYHAFTLNYTEAEKLAYMDEDTSTASWNEDVPNALAALFTAAGGNGTAGDLIVNKNMNVRPRDFPRGAGIELDSDGYYYVIYNFRTFQVNASRTVRFSQNTSSDSDNIPVKVVALKSIAINGSITVTGGRGVDGEATATNSKVTPANGGNSGPGGGDGAARYSGSAPWTSIPEMDGDDVVFEGVTYSTGGLGGEGPSNPTYYSLGGGAGGGGARTDGKAGTDGGYNQAAWRGVGGKGGKGYPANYDRKPNVGGAGGGAGALGGMAYSSYNWRNGAGTGGGGGGSITIQSAGDVRIGNTGGILAAGGGGGGTTPYAYYGGAGGGGGGGSVLVRATGVLTLDPAAQIDVAGGPGGLYLYTSTNYKGGEGGEGGTGYIRLEAMRDDPLDTPVIEGIATAQLTYLPSLGLYEPQGGGAPSIGQTVWANLGVFDPSMIKPGIDDVIAEVYNDTMIIEVQMAIEDANNLGNPYLGDMDITDSNNNGEYDDSVNENTLSNWTKIANIETLNGHGYQYLRTRVTFQLSDDQTVDAPLPFLNRLTLPFKF